MSEFVEDSRNPHVMPCSLERVRLQEGRPFFEMGGDMGTMCFLWYFSTVFTHTAKNYAAEDMSDPGLHVLTCTPLCENTGALQSYTRCMKYLTQR